METNTDFLSTLSLKDPQISGTFGAWSKCKRTARDQRMDRTALGRQKKSSQHCQSAL